MISQIGDGFFNPNNSYHGARVDQTLANADNDDATLRDVYKL